MFPCEPASNIHSHSCQGFLRTEAEKEKGREERGRETEKERERVRESEGEKLTLMKWREDLNPTISLRTSGAPLTAAMYEDDPSVKQLTVDMRLRAEEKWKRCCSNN